MNQKAITFDYNLSDKTASVVLVGVNATNANNPVAAANATNANPPFATGLQVKPLSALAIIVGLHATTASEQWIFTMDSDNNGNMFGSQLLLVLVRAENGCNNGHLQVKPRSVLVIVDHRGVVRIHRIQ
jgi:hypothetical protein